MLGVRFAHLCCKESGLDATILQEVVHGTNHLGVSKNEHVHDGRLIVRQVLDRDGRLMQNDEHLNSGSRTESRQFEERFRRQGSNF